MEAMSALHSADDRKPSNTCKPETFPMQRVYLKIRYLGLPLGTPDVAVLFFHGEAGFFEALVDFVGYEYRAVMAAGATKRNRQIRFAFADIVRQEIDEQFRDLTDELRGLRERTDITRHAWMTAGQLLELGYVVGVWEKANIEY